MAQYTTVASMIGQRNGTQASVPTQGFAASNLIGTPVPVVGDNKARPNYMGNVGQKTSAMHIIFIAVGIILAGYVLFHVNFEK